MKPKDQQLLEKATVNFMKENPLVGIVFRHVEVTTGPSYSNQNEVVHRLRFRSAKESHANNQFVIISQDLVKDLIEQLKQLDNS
jgi:hypothetical protein